MAVVCKMHLLALRSENMFVYLCRQKHDYQLHQYLSIAISIKISAQICQFRLAGLTFHCLELQLYLFLSTYSYELRCSFKAQRAC